MSFITGTAIYPNNFDLNPTGTGTSASLSFVLDQIRDGNGLITQSGNTLIAKDINVTYTVLDQIERVLGLNPEGSYADVASRISAISSSGAFVHITGDTITGPITLLSGMNVNNITSDNLNWIMSGNTSVNASGDVSLVTTGNISLNIGNVNIIGSSLQVNTNSLIVSGTTIVGNSITTSNASADIGSTGSYFNNIYVNNIISAGSTGLSFIPSSGGMVNGNLNFSGLTDIVLGSGSNISNTFSGINDLGDASNPFGNTFTKTLYVTNITGMSPVRILSNVELASGSSIGAIGTGLTIGSVSNPISVIYASSIIGATGLDVSAVVAKSGSDIFGNITFSGNANIVINSGSNILSSASGIGDIGSIGTPLGSIYAKYINNQPQTNYVFNEMLTGTTNGVNKRFFFSQSPLYAMVFVSGSLILPVSQYVISGTSLFLTGSMYAPTTSPTAGFYIY